MAKQQRFLAVNRQTRAAIRGPWKRVKDLDKRLWDVRVINPRSHVKNRWRKVTGAFGSYVIKVA